MNSCAYEAKTDILTVLGDYGDRNESQTAIDGPLRGAVDYCQKVAPSEGWKARLAKGQVVHRPLHGVAFQSLCHHRQERHPLGSHALDRLHH